MSEGSDIAPAALAPDARPAAASPAATAARPPASRAQLFQACFAGAQAALTLGILIVGYQGIFYNVIPTWELRTAREEAARLGQESAEFKAEIERSKGELAILQSSLANDRHALGRYQVLTRRYVIEQFTTKLASQVPDPRWDWGRGWGLFTMDHKLGSFLTKSPVQLFHVSRRRYDT